MNTFDSYKIFVVSLPGSPKRRKIQEEMLSQSLVWEWIDGVRIYSMNEIPLAERDQLEAYCVPRLKEAPEYVCRVIGCKRAMVKAIKAVESCGSDWGVIVQDDARFVDEFDTKLRTLLSELPDYVNGIMLYYSGGGVRRENNLLRVIGDVRGMVGFAIRPSFSPIMVKALLGWGGEADRIWARLAGNGAFMYVSNPSLIYTTQKGSDIIGGIPELRHLWS